LIKKKRHDEKGDGDCQTRKERGRSFKAGFETPGLQWEKTTTTELQGARFSGSRQKEGYMGRTPPAQNASQANLLVQTVDERETDEMEVDHLKNALENLLLVTPKHG